MEVKNLSLRRHRPCRLALSGAMYLLLGFASAGAEPSAPAAQGQPAQDNRATSPITNEWCPVLEDEPVDPEIHTKYEGVEVYLCCQKCLKQFRANPAAFVGNIPALASSSDARGSQEAEAEHGEHEHEETAEDDHDSEAMG